MNIGFIRVGLFGEPATLMDPDWYQVAKLHQGQDSGQQDWQDRNCDKTASNHCLKGRNLYDDYDGYN